MQTPQYCLDRSRSPLGARYLHPIVDELERRTGAEPALKVIDRVVWGKYIPTAPN